MAAIAPKVAKFSDWREAIDFFRASGASGASGPSGVGNVGNVGKGNSKTNVGNRMNVGVLDFTLQSLARQDQWQWCLQILDEVKEQRFWPHQMAYCHAIQASRRQGRWDVSLSLVASCEEQGLVPDTPMLNLAIGSCGYGREWERAIALLSEFPLRRLQCSDYSYNAAFGALGSSRQWAHVLALVESMASTRVALDRGMRESAARSAALGKRQMQIDVTESLSTADWQEAIDCLVAMQLQSLQADIRVHNAVISACRRSTKWAEALACFEDVPAKDRTVVTATTLLGCLGDAGLWQEALHRFSLIRSDNAANVDPYMCNTVLQAFKNSGKWQWCLWLLTEMSHSISSNSLASKSRPPSLPPPDTLSFNTVIGSAAESGRWQLAFDLLRVMVLQKERPNVRTFNAAIAACAEASEWQRALLLQQELPKHQLKPTDVTYVSLLKAMNSANELHRSLKMLKEMRRENVAPGATAYSGVIAACGTHGKYDTAKGLLDEMRQFQVESNAVVLNAAMSAFIKCGILGDAYQIYYDMSKQQVRPDLETYNTLMQSFVQQSYWEGALHTLETIRSSTQDPDAISYTTAIDACRKGSFWQEAIHLCWEMRLQHVQPDIITFGATIAACAEGARSDGSGSWAFALKLFDEAQLEGLTMSTPCLNNALQACVIASYWESSLALASELNGSLEYVAPDLVNSNLQLAALTMSHQWKHALHLLKHNFSQRGHQIDASTYNSANIGMPEPQTELVGGQRTTGEEDTATGVQEFREYLMRTFIESDVGRKAFFSGDHVLDLHGMSLSSAKMALQLALDDAKQKPRTLLIVTGQGKHSTGEPLLKEGVASMLDKLQLHARAVAGGFYVQTWRGEHKHKNGNLVKERREAVDAHESAGVNKKWLGQGGSMPSSIRQLDYWSAIEAFELYDSKRLGFLDKPAFYTMLRGLTRKRDYMDEKLSDHIFDEIDINQSGGIDKEEFLGWVFETNNFRLNHLREKLVDMSEEEVQKIFRKIDKTGNGQLDKEEFWHFIQSIGGIPPEASGDLHEFIDSDNSGLISFDEFLNWVHPDRELELLEKHHADWKLDLVRLSDYQRPEKPLMETRPGKPVVIELWIGPDYKFMADRMKLMLCQMFSPEQVHWEFKMDGRISGTCSLVLAKVGRGIELWNRDSMMAYREDPFLDSSGSTARKWLTDVLHKCLPDVERASNLHRLKQRRHLAHHRQGSKQKH